MTARREEWEIREASAQAKRELRRALELLCRVHSPAHEPVVRPVALADVGAPSLDLREVPLRGAWLRGLDWGQARVPGPDGIRGAVLDGGRVVEVQAGVPHWYETARVIGVEGAATDVPGRPETRTAIGDSGSAVPARLDVGHESVPSCIQSLRDGRIVTAGYDGTVRLWERGSARPAAVWHLGSSPIAMVELRNGRLAIADESGRLVLHTVGKGLHEGADEAVKLTDSHPGEPNSCLCALRDGMLAVGRSDGRIQIWQERTPNVPVAEWRGHDGRITAVVELSNSRLASCGDDRSVRIWDPARLASPPDVIHVAADDIRCACALRDGGMATGGSAGRIWVWTGDGSGSPEMTAPPQESIGAIVELLDRRLVTAGDQGSIRVWHPPVGGRSSWYSHECVTRWSRSTGVVELDDGAIAAVGDDSSVRIWNLRDPQPQETLERPSTAVWSLTERRDGTFASAGFDGTLRTWTRNPHGSMELLHEHDGWMRSVIELGSGSLATADSDATVRVWHPQWGTVLESHPAHSEAAWCVVELHDGRLASGGQDGRIAISGGVGSFSTASNYAWETGRGPVSCLMQLRSGRLACGSEDGTLAVWELAASADCRIGEPQERLIGQHDAPVNDLVELTDGYLAAATDAGSVSIWRPGAALAVELLEVSDAWTLRVRELSDTRLLTTYSDGTARIWRRGIEVPEAILRGHDGTVWTALQLRDGTIVTAGDDGSVREWSLERGECIRTRRFIGTDIVVVEDESGVHFRNHRRGWKSRLVNGQWLPCDAELAQLARFEKGGERFWAYEFPSRLKWASDWSMDDEGAGSQCLTLRWPDNMAPEELRQRLGWIETP